MVCPPLGIYPSSVHRVCHSGSSAGWEGEDQAERESYIEIHQHYPSNHAKSHHNKTNEARKLKLHVKLKKYHAELSVENGHGDLI